MILPGAGLPASLDVSVQNAVQISYTPLGFVTSFPRQLNLAWGWQELLRWARATACFGGLARRAE
jgi:hypothetical protein